MSQPGSVHTYFQRALNRSPGPVPPEAVWRYGEDGCMAAFRTRLECGRIAEVDYRSTKCATLLALCEHLAELIPGLTPADALACSAERLLALHPEIPAGRRDRASLAVSALHACLPSSVQETL